MAKFHDKLKNFFHWPIQRTFNNSGFRLPSMREYNNRGIHEPFNPLELNQLVQAMIITTDELPRNNTHAIMSTPRDNEEGAGDYFDTMRDMLLNMRTNRIDIRGKKKYHLDVKYPHACFNEECGKELYFKEAMIQFRSANLSEMPNPSNPNYLIMTDVQFNFEYAIFYLNIRKKFLKLWKSKHVKFYCCDCHENEKNKRWYDKRRSESRID